MAETVAASRLATLSGYLERDPDNLPLLADAAEAALDERQPERAIALLLHYTSLATLPPREINLLGLAALQTHRFEEAERAFAALMADGADDPGLRFNLAWARAHLKDFEAALAALDDDTAAALPQAATLRIQLLHQLARLDEATEAARRYRPLHPGHAPLMAAISVLAIDVEDEALAAECAAAAGDHPDALTTLGTLALGDEHATQAVQLFERALATNGQVPRAWIGLGLAKLLTGDPASAPADIDRGAEMFGDHLGSWIAAGWAHFINRDLETARTRFETALALDDSFAEAHGSLAALAVMTGQVEEARRRCAIALRLDQQCYSAALAQSLLAAGEGDADTARRIFDLAANAPIDGSGRTIGSALAKLGMGLR